jgi:hypothetical protein
VPAALGTVTALGAPDFGAQNRAGAPNLTTHIHTQGQSVRNPCSRRDPNAQDSRIAAGYFVGDEDAAALDAGEAGLDGSFSTFARDADGNVTKYTTYGPSSPEDPEPYRPTLRYDETGRSHFNEATGEYVDTPHVHDPGTPGGVCSPLPIEIP